MKDLFQSTQGLTLDEHGIWQANRQSSVSYPEAGHQGCFAVEDDSFWFQHRNQCITSLVRRYPPGAEETVLEIGGGNGVVSKALQQAGYRVALLEPGAEGAMNAKRRGVATVIRGTLEDVGFQPQSQAAVGLFDVIEHIADEVDFLAQVRTIVRPGGRLYLTVPAWQWLWSVQDVEAGHFRRYSRAQIERRITEAGFEVDFSSYLFWTLPLPVLLLRALPYRLGLQRPGPSDAETATDHGTEGGLGARLLSWTLGPEAGRLRKGKRIPFGSSCIIAASARS